MNTIIVMMDEAGHAHQQLMRTPGQPVPPGATHWILVACPPRMTRHLSKWVNHRHREHWRDKWAQKQFAALQPLLQARGDRVSTIVADAPLPELTRSLLDQEGAAQVLDLRRPKFSPERPA